MLTAPISQCDKGAKGFGDGDDYYDSYLVVVLKPLELDEEDTEKVQDAQFSNIKAATNKMLALKGALVTENIRGSRAVEDATEEQREALVIAIENSVFQQFKT